MRALSAWLDANLFRQGPPPKPLTPQRLLIGIALAVAGIAIVLARLGFSPPLDSMFAEDGTIFYSGAVHLSFLDAVRTTYAGYLHLVPRLLAEPPTWFGVGNVPVVIALEASSVVVLCAFIVWWTSAAHLRDPLRRGMLAALVVLLPVVGFEALASLAYLQWFLLFPAFWLLLWRPQGLGRGLAGGGFLFLSLGSAPVGLLLTPLAVTRLVIARDRADLALAGGFALGAAVQLIGIAFDQSPPQPGPAFSSALLALYPLRVVAGVFTGNDGAAALGHEQVLGWPMGAIFVVLLVIAMRRVGPERALSVIAICLSAAIFLIEGYRRDLGFLLDLTAAGAPNIGARYTILPALLLIAGVLLALREPRSSAGPGRPRAHRTDRGGRRDRHRRPDLLRRFRPRPRQPPLVHGNRAGPRSVRLGHGRAGDRSGVRSGRGLDPETAL